MMLGLRSSTSIRVAKGRTSSVKVFARGPIVTKRGVAFKGGQPPVPTPDPEESELATIDYTLIATGIVANPVVLWSAWTLSQTGEGLPPGPGGAVGALEGVSYLVILGVIAYSLYTKVATGRGLPAGPAGLLGAVEGFSYLSLLAAIAGFAAYGRI
eukprot:CAMPEP_0119109142 /NCGR_PEP_ID=MMETSP1180-20130426/17402_1 /TAXON_ID=3052 ORGANISM="Chlamydomonas cf sp, Strain CCMP681" /NCGR_SAMPLE_ID=MMETSP1180 /ASSEMBLY_ACC=CAM_ASM_000741 /LENGTH=155 /DNA_ID=CAMNT_0007094857 /DNA_START=46 /DNA_END=513 /DNA_ORIENTATION=+